MTHPALADWQLNLSPGVTPISHDVYDLHMAVIAICTGIAVVVYGMLAFIIIRYRRSKGAVAAHFSDNNKVEIVWTVVPFLLLCAIAVPATRVLFDMDDYDAADVTIKITGHQWYWQYQYLDQGVEFYSNLSTPPAQFAGSAARGEWYLLEVDRPLVLPVGKKVRFLVTSNDVIHSWWVPQLGVKRDAIPGFVHEAWTRIEKPGTYRGQCAELCGVHHAYMPIVVEAVSESQFADWIHDTAVQARATRNTPSDWTMEHTLQRGSALYAAHCAACHKENGRGRPPLFPALQGSSIVVGTEVSRHIKLVLYGVPGTAMQAFAPQLDDEELAAIITWERNAWGNNTGDLVTPADVQALRR
ncbi:MAG: cytochrome c oxidase subunit II [Gammaproteobacteria bacterium]|nr:MAG: cytochrome c oxidase subunit II [Gammaproteobacteria bacterium]